MGMKMTKYIIYIYKIAKGIINLNVLDIYFYFMLECFCVHVCLCSTHMHTWYPQKPGKGIRCPGTGVRDNWELPCRC